MTMTEEQLEKQRKWRKADGNATTKRYEKTPRGFLMRLYRNMKSRTSGVQKLKYHLYRGKCLLDKQEFYTWALSQESFWKLYSKWVASGYERRLAPSADRVDPSKGYELPNLEWVTMGENSRRGTLSRFKVI